MVLGRSAARVVTQSLLYLQTKLALKDSKLSKYHDQNCRIIHILVVILNSEIVVVP